MVNALTGSRMRTANSGPPSASKQTYRGLPFRSQSMDDAVTDLIERAESRRGGLVVTPNLQILRELYGRPELCMALRNCIAYPDGRGAILLARAEGVELGPRITGADLLPRLAARLAAAPGGSQVRLVLAGKAPQDAVAVLTSRHLGLRVMSVPLPYAENGEDLSEALLAGLPAGPCIVVICLGFPKQEACALAARLTRPDVVMVGAGAAADLLAGNVRRAPNLVQGAGFEWLWRLASEPRRLWRRYLLGDIPFLARSLVVAARNRLLRREPLVGPASGIGHDDDATELRKIS